MPQSCPPRPSQRAVALTLPSSTSCACACARRTRASPRSRCRCPIRPGLGGPRSSVRVSAAPAAAGRPGGGGRRGGWRRGGMLRPDGAAGRAGSATTAAPWSRATADWIAVAGVEEVPVGTAVRFTTPAFDGYVVNDGGAIRALLARSAPTWAARSSSDRSGSDLRCPCHGASFDLKGQLANGRDRLAAGRAATEGDERAYPIELPDLRAPARSGSSTGTSW